MYMYIFYQSHLKYIYPYFLLTRLSLNLTSMFMLQLCEDDALLGIILLSVLPDGMGEFKRESTLDNWKKNCLTILKICELILVNNLFYKTIK